MVDAVTFSSNGVSFDATLDGIRITVDGSARVVSWGAWKRITSAVREDEVRTKKPNNVIPLSKNA